MCVCGTQMYLCVSVSEYGACICTLGRVRVLGGNEIYISVCVCVCERERERHKYCVSERGKKEIHVCVCVCLCVCCACVHMCAENFSEAH